ncbi:hypothetical protein, partial [Staphylococcus haemolyticus]|uniref:hypothetical protein n=1 Tax=Staphylococcus haemolyticus TaxID=1283 RepID=UPI001E47028E
MCIRDRRRASNNQYFPILIYFEQIHSFLICYIYYYIIVDNKFVCPSFMDPILATKIEPTTVKYFEDILQLKLYSIKYHRYKNI